MPESVGLKENKGGVYLCRVVVTHVGHPPQALLLWVAKARMISDKKRDSCLFNLLDSWKIHSRLICIINSLLIAELVELPGSLPPWSCRSSAKTVETEAVLRKIAPLGPFPCLDWPP